MAKRNVWVDAPLTWDGVETTVIRYQGKEVQAGSSGEVWNETAALWTDDVVEILKQVAYGGSRGGVRTKQDTWNAWDEIDNVNKKKVVKVILTLKGVRHIAEQDINEYNVTIEDLELVLEEYEKYKVTIENVEII